jgi:hypothetical protein
MDERGGTLVELIMVMMLLLLFGATIYTLIYSGSETQRKIIEQKNEQSEVRVAFSYVNVRLRQNDSLDAISIEPNEINGGNALRIAETSEYGDYDRWIFWDGGLLQESVLSRGEPMSMGLMSVIARVEGFDIEKNPDGSITSTIYYLDDGAEKSLSNVVYLRSS